MDQNFGAIHTNLSTSASPIRSCVKRGLSCLIVDYASSCVGWLWRWLLIWITFNFWFHCERMRERMTRYCRTFRSIRIRGCWFMPPYISWIFMASWFLSKVTTAESKRSQRPEASEWTTIFEVERKGDGLLITHFSIRIDFNLIKRRGSLGVGSMIFNVFSPPRLMASRASASGNRKYTPTLCLCFRLGEASVMKWSKPI